MKSFIVGFLLCHCFKWSRASRATPDEVPSLTHASVLWGFDLTKTGQLLDWLILRQFSGIILNMTAPLFEIRDLKASILTLQGAVRVVDGVSLKIEEKQSVGLLGESGCGKTSLIYAMLGYFSVIHRFKQAAITKGRLMASPDYQFSPEEWGQAVSGQALYRGKDLLAMTDTERSRIMGRYISYIPQGLQGALNPQFSIGYQTGEALE